MKIGYFLKQTLIDYPEKLAAEVFTSECNYKCPTCHAKNVLERSQRYSEEDIFSYLEKTKGFIDGIVICGGEPTLQNDLPEFARKLKDLGLSVKVDTNGSNPRMLESLLGIVDYVAMDIKGPREKYSEVAGVNVSLEDIEKSILAVAKFPNYEFRTTIVPIVENNFRWISEDEADKMAKWIVDITGTNQHKYFLQKFIARGKNEMLNERFSKENLPVDFTETPDAVLENLKKSIEKYLQRCEIR